ncbi:MAG: integrase [Bradyrhizobium sp.]|nr:integrase [Bradyrhizobium sp.]
MGRAEQRLYTVGRFWLALRAESPFYQIRWYDERAKITRGKSTRRRALEDAIPVILAHEEADRSDWQQTPDELLAVAAFLKFWEERGVSRRNAPAIESSLRIFTAFLDHDRVTIGATVSALKPDVFNRFIAWRSAPHSYKLDWRAKVFEHSSNGVSGETIQRNLEDVRAALNHAVNMGRLTLAPKVRSVDPETRSPPRSDKLTIEQLGAIVGYAAYDIEALRWVLAMLATGARPDAINAWNVPEQWKERGPNFDTHPKGWPITKKRNAVVPIIPEFRPWLEAWAVCPHKPVRSRKTWWRTMRSALGLPPQIVPRTIKHSVATELRWRGVSMDEIAGLLGHIGVLRITQGYAKYDPSRLPQAKQHLSAIWQDVCAEANKWLTNHIRVTAAYKQPISVVRKLENV